MIEDIMLDQTQFVTESPLLEEVEAAGEADKNLSAEELKQFKQKKLKKIIIAVIVFLLMALGIFALIKLGSKKESQEIIEVEEIELTEVVVGPFNQRLLELKNELEAADPNQEEFPFPPIDSSINLEEQF